MMQVVGHLMRKYRRKYYATLSGFTFYDSIFIKQWNSLLMWFSESARDREIVLSIVGTLKKKQAFCHKPTVINKLTFIHMHLTSLC